LPLSGAEGALARGAAAPRRKEGGPPAGGRPGRRPGAAAGAGRRPGRDALQQGGLAAQGADLGSGPRVLEEGAAGRGLGLPHPGPDPAPRLARQPAATQTRPGERPLRDQLLGCRVPVDRRMSAATQALLGWTLAAALGTVAATMVLRGGR